MRRNTPLILPATKVEHRRGRPAGTTISRTTRVHVRIEPASRGLGRGIHRAHDEWLFRTVLTLEKDSHQMARSSSGRFSSRGHASNFDSSTSDTFSRACTSRFLLAPRLLCQSISSEICSRLMIEAKADIHDRLHYEEARRLSGILPEY